MTAQKAIAAAVEQLGDARTYRKDALATPPSSTRPDHIPDAVKELSSAKSVLK